MWLDWLVFCEHGFSVSALWCLLATPTTLLGFLLPWAWGMSSQVLQQNVATAPYLGWGVSPHHPPSWPSMWDGSSRPPCACAATAPIHNNSQYSTFLKFSFYNYFFPILLTSQCFPVTLRTKFKLHFMAFKGHSELALAIFLGSFPMILPFTWLSLCPVPHH